MCASVSHKFTACINHSNHSSHPTQHAATCATARSSDPIRPFHASAIMRSSSCRSFTRPKKVCSTRLPAMLPAADCSARRVQVEVVSLSVVPAVVKWTAYKNVSIPSARGVPVPVCVCVMCASLGMLRSPTRLCDCLVRRTVPSHVHGLLCFRALAYTSRCAGHVRFSVQCS